MPACRVDGLAGMQAERNAALQAELERQQVEEAAAAAAVSRRGGLQAPVRRKELPQVAAAADGVVGASADDSITDCMPYAMPLCCSQGTGWVRRWSCWRAAAARSWPCWRDCRATAS